MSRLYKFRFHNQPVLGGTPGGGAEPLKSGYKPPKKPWLLPPIMIFASVLIKLFERRVIGLPNLPPSIPKACLPAGRPMA